MTPEMLLALMLTMKCHTMKVDIPERRETVVQTVCVKVQPMEPQAVKSKPVAKKAKPVKKKKKRRRRR